PVVTGDPNAPVTVRGISVTNPARVLEPAGVTKLALARYYDAVAEQMLPYVADRPLTIVRCPHGAAGHMGCFYQKHPETRGWPKGFRTVEVTDSTGPATYFYLDTAESLVALAQLGTLEIHTWNSMAADAEHPDRIVFDLDPGPGVTFAQVSDGARTVRDSLAALGLGSFVKTTGGHGLHVVAPITVQRGYDEVRDFAHSFVAFLAKQAPERFIGVMSKEKRPGLVFIDYLRNAHGATAVCAYSTRARPGTPVSVPIAWDELPAIADPAAFDTVSVPKRLATLGTDPWAGYEDARAPLTDAVLSAVATPLLP
ncbi:MAG TPA: non-homologous end-joining DNA ligase, partial [Coriobacteriia bacterium]